MSMRQPFVAGNWKMFTNAMTARALAASVAEGVTSMASWKSPPTGVVHRDLAGPVSPVHVAVCPPFPYLGVVAEALRGSPVELGAQNCYPEKEGPFTGEVSPAMLVDVGCRWVILGHSERRHVLGESDAFINRKIKAALAAGLGIIFCVGETLQEREKNRTERVLETQLAGGLDGLDTPAVAKIVVAYEPFWAIGTGRNATPEQAQLAHAFIRNQISRRFGEETARGLPIQYGGSVKPENAASLLGQPDVDGALVGGASLRAEQFLAIVRAGA
jgi:triosephosphate isomerase